LQANPIPFLVYSDACEKGTLRGNPQLQELAQVDECLVVLQGPQRYITPSRYATKRETGNVVPTWNYIMVHAWGRPRVIDDAAWLRQQVGVLTASREDARSAPWAVDDEPADFVAHQLRRSSELNSDRAQRRQMEGQSEPAGRRSGWCRRRIARRGRRDDGHAPC
jgi:transcriptional regulator